MCSSLQTETHCLQSRLGEYRVTRCELCGSCQRQQFILALSYLDVELVQLQAVLLAHHLQLEVTRRMQAAE